MAESKVIHPPNSAHSPPPNCAICLGSFSNKCFSDSCMHQFCFKCLLEWSKIKAECPLCKQPFKRIIHNVKSNEEYDEHVVDIPPNEEIHIIDNEEFLFLPLGGTPQPSARHHFHFRTTFTVDTRGEHAIQQMLLTHPLTNGGHISIGGYPSRSLHQRQRRREREHYTTTSFRRSIYRRNLWVNALADVTGSYREVSPSFFRDCPGARTRLVPWLNRELNALLYENTQLVMHLVDIIMDLLFRHHICSRTFRNMLFDYLDNKTDHFIHEFYNFMRSPFDMIGYDRYVTYSERPRSPPYVVTLPDDFSDSNDSDVIIVGATNPQEPVVIDLVNDDTDSDEPILVHADDNTPTVPLPIQQTITIAEDNTTDHRSRSRSLSPPMITMQETPRPTALPPKLRFKIGSAGCGRNGGQSTSRGDYHHPRSTARSKRKKKSSAWSRSAKRRQRSRSTSSSSTTSSSSFCDSSTSSSEESPRETHKRYKEKKRLLKKLIKTKRPRSTVSSESDVFIEKCSSSDSDVPLSNLKTRRKQLKKVKKSTSHTNLTSSTKSKKDSRSGRGGRCNGTLPASTITSNDMNDYSATKALPTSVVDPVPEATVTATSSLPGCSRYGTEIDSTSLAEVSGTPLDLVIGKRHNENGNDSNFAPTSSRYHTHSSYRPMTPEEVSSSYNPVAILKFDNSSAEDDYPLNRLLKKEIKEEPLSTRRKSSSSTPVVVDNSNNCNSNHYNQKLSRSNGRLRNILIKKEESTNMWYSYPRNYDSDSSSN